MECPTLVAGQYISFVVREDGIVVYSGSREWKSDPGRFAPVETEGGNKEVRFPRWISCSDGYYSIVDSEGVLWRLRGRLETTIFKRVDGVPPLVYSFRNRHYSLSLDEQGQLWNHYKYDGHIIELKEPSLVKFPTRIVKVLDLNDTVLIEDESGKLFQNSISNAGPTSPGKFDEHFEEIDIDNGFPGVKSLSGRSFVSAILDIEGKVWTRGRSTYTGRDSTFPATKFHEIGLERITNLCAGEYSALASDEEGHLWVWGAGTQWQLGNGGNNDEKLPKRLDEFAFVKHVACGKFHGIVSDIEGNLWGFGWNLHGELGLGDKTERMRPTIVPGISVHHGNSKRHCKKPNY